MYCYLCRVEIAEKRETLRRGVMNTSRDRTRFGSAHKPIVIVDDDPDDASRLRRILQQANILHPVVMFSDAEHAIDYLAYLIEQPPSLWPCLLFVDLQLMPAGGFGLIGWIRSQRQFNKVHVIALSSQDVTGEAERAIELGANVHLEKFPDPEVLRTVLSETARR